MNNSLKLIALILSIYSSVVLAVTDKEIANQLIQASIIAHSGQCACPFSEMKNGSACGKRSAYSKAGGNRPLCYRNDVSLLMINKWRVQTGSNHAAQSKQKAHAAKTLPQGSFSGLYNRGDWKHWIDSDGDCQNTRTEVLIRQSMGRVTFTNHKRCSVKAGAWLDPYSGLSYSRATDLDIDHVVPLSWANGHGGSGWSKSRKRKFANDITNLMAVENGLNRAKGDKGPDEWMPPRHEYRCEYLKRFDDVVIAYRLMYAPSEKRTINRMKKACGQV